MQVQQGGEKATEELQGSRYYYLPNKIDEWEIERRYVSIDYMHKLGEGAFGSVYLGIPFSERNHCFIVEEEFSPRTSLLEWVDP